jgi:carbonic anhydrase
MPVLDEILAANASYAAGFAKGDLAAPPGRRFAIVTCMDARLDPARFAGLSEGDAHVIRNAGGIVTDDALRSLVISHWLLGTREAFVIGHSDCGMEKFTDDQLRQKLADEAGADASGVEFHAFPGGVRSSVAASVARIRESDLLPDSFTAAGFVYDVRSGTLEQVG